MVNFRLLVVAVNGLRDLIEYRFIFDYASQGRGDALNADFFGENPIHTDDSVNCPTDQLEMRRTFVYRR